jgi:hypothetical protein
MTLGPDDLPEDPFGPTGLAQIICKCPNRTDGPCDTFHFITTANGTTQAVCTNCSTINGEWPQSPQVEDTAHHARMNPPHPLPGARDTLQAQAEWQQPDTAPQYDPGNPPPLPSYSAGMCNTYLDGGPYDTQIVWLMVPTDEFRTHGLPGAYTPAGRLHEGRAVYTWHPDQT